MKEMMDTANEDTLSVFLSEGGRGEVGTPVICVSLSRGSAVTSRFPFPAALLSEQLKANIFLNLTRNHCRYIFFLELVKSRFNSGFKLFSSSKGAAPFCCQRLRE